MIVTSLSHLVWVATAHITSVWLKTSMSLSTTIASFRFGYSEKAIMAATMTSRYVFLFTAMWAEKRPIAE